MESITLRYTFLLENNTKKYVVIKDIKPDITDAEIVALANTLIQKGAEYNGSKFKSMVFCEKTSSVVEKIYS